MTFSNIHFILNKPQLSENIGSSIRALKNFRFSNLTLVSPKINFPNEKIIATSVGAKNLIKKVKIYNNFEDSIKNFNYIIATTTRVRKKNFKYIEIKDLKKINFNKKVAFVFGPESSGLSNDEISYANYLIKLPTNPFFSSLNLSHSLIIVCYELFNILNKKKYTHSSNKIIIPKKKYTLKFLNFLIRSLDEIGFLQPAEKRKSMISNIKSIFLKMNLSEKEIRVLFSIFGSLIKKKG